MEKNIAILISNLFGTDPTKAIQIDNGLEVVVCPHSDGSRKEIKLQQCHDGNKIVGMFGYCYTCEKVYYSPSQGLLGGR